MYRYQQHLYDATRKFYLLGRDRLLSQMEIGVCRTSSGIKCKIGRHLTLAHLSVCRNHPKVGLSRDDRRAHTGNQSGSIRIYFNYLFGVLGRLDDRRFMRCRMPMVVRIRLCESYRVFYEERKIVIPDERGGDLRVS